MTTGWAAVDRLLDTDPDDGGCELALALLHVYAELARSDVGTARERLPAVAAHLRSCGPCAEDLEGLLAAIRLDDPDPETDRDRYRTD